MKTICYVMAIFLAGFTVSMAGSRGTAIGKGVTRTVTLQGKASWYGSNLNGCETASGKRYNQNEMVAAHKSLPFGTRVEVINLKNHRSVVVTIIDRGPYKKGRIIDLSKAAARKLAMFDDGVVPVEVRILSRG